MEVFISIYTIVTYVNTENKKKTQKIENVKNNLWMVATRAHSYPC